MGNYIFLIILSILVFLGGVVVGGYIIPEEKKPVPYVHPQPESTEPNAVEKVIPYITPKQRLLDLGYNVELEHKYINQWERWGWQITIRKRTKNEDITFCFICNDVEAGLEDSYNRVAPMELGPNAILYPERVLVSKKTEEKTEEEK